MNMDINKSFEPLKNQNLYEYETEDLQRLKEFERSYELFSRKKIIGSSSTKFAFTLSKLYFFYLIIQERPQLEDEKVSSLPSLLSSPLSGSRVSQQTSLLILKAKHGGYWLQDRLVTLLLLKEEDVCFVEDVEACRSIFLSYSQLRWT